MHPSPCHPPDEAAPPMPCALLDDACQHTAAILERVLPSAAAPPARLHEAMRYALLGGGKRVRPALVLGACRAVGGSDDMAAHAMAAVEILHTYTLVHDDLPAMDDDDLRRGRPTVHKVWDEATAILVGDALQALAFSCLSKLPGATAGAAVAALGAAAGSEGVVGGQQDDLDAEGGRGHSGGHPAALLERIHRRKTAALIRVSCHLGALSGGGDETAIAHLSAFGEHIGLAFQIVDDLLDTTADASTLGKTPGKDASVGKLTWVSVHGEAAARTAAAEHTAAAHAHLEPFAGAAEDLRQLSELLLGRGH